jgi:hypothetical protein
VRHSVTFELTAPIILSNNRPFGWREGSVLAIDDMDGRRQAAALAIVLSFSTGQVRRPNIGEVDALVTGGHGISG